MRILLTGSTGYIGRRLLPVLLAQGHQVVCPVRDPRRFDAEDFSAEERARIQVCKADLLDIGSLRALPRDIDAAYYLVHAMGSSYSHFDQLEEIAACNFADYLRDTTCRQQLYLGGIANAPHLSKHLGSRKHVEEVLARSGVPLTVLRAAIIIGSGGASFEIIRDLVEKLPVMVAPRWVHTLSQPIAVRNVVEYLTGLLLEPRAYGRTFDIGGPDVLTYKDMLLQYAQVRGLRRHIQVVPVLTPRLSSYWLYFVTSTSYRLARSLVDSMHVEVVCREGVQDLHEILPLHLYTYKEALQMAFARIANNEVTSSWKDAITGPVPEDFLDRVEVPRHGVFTDHRVFPFERNAEDVLDNLWRIGGERGWYYGNKLWLLRGLLDKLVGGVGLRRGRRSPVDLKAGDALDFWRVLVADRLHRRLLLFAEMRLPGEAWLEWRIREREGGGYVLEQTATFRPLGLWGRVYWYLVLPFHSLVFPGMAQGVLQYGEKS